MTDNLVRMPALRGTKLDAKSARAYTELLAQTIGSLDKQIERAEKLPGADPTYYFLRAIRAHVETEMDACVQLRGSQS